MAVVYQRFQKDNCGFQAQHETVPASNRQTPGEGDGQTQQRQDRERSATSNCLRHFQITAKGIRKLHLLGRATFRFKQGRGADKNANAARS